ncbi:hypothetical protein AOQ89_00770 [bacterium endosymbiont of Pedicinus badii]|nr:hypothetical protein AOQ89_00770 [bacterium endosymbiont of Pedicinus badii]
MIYLNHFYNFINKIFIKNKKFMFLLNWLFFMHFISIFGILFYVFFGKNKISKRFEKYKEILSRINKEWKKKRNKKKIVFSYRYSKTAHPLFQFCNLQQDLQSMKIEKIKLYTNTKRFMQSLLVDIKNAKYSIDIVFYIWNSKGIVYKVTKELINAAKRGVCCRIILDDAGSKKFFKSKNYKLFLSYGINIVKAFKINIFSLFITRIDLRQHKKMIIIDEKQAYIGSMNMVDPCFFKKNIGIGNWIDIMIKIHGPIIFYIKMIFNCDWEFETGKKILLPCINLKKNKIFKKNDSIHYIASGPGFKKGIIHKAFLIAIHSARKKIIITTPYFIPTNDLVYAICTAAQRGVKVFVIIPKKIDSFPVYWARRVFFKDLLTSGVVIYQFFHGLLHTKSILIDNRLSLIGTANFDMRSLWLNSELTIIIDSKKFGKKLKKLQEKYIALSKAISFYSWKKRPIWKKLLERFFYLFSPLL